MAAEGVRGGGGGGRAPPPPGAEKAEAENTVKNLIWQVAPEFEFEFESFIYIIIIILILQIST